MMTKTAYYMQMAQVSISAGQTFLHHLKLCNQPCPCARTVKHHEHPFVIRKTHL